VGRLGEDRLEKTIVGMRGGWQGSIGRFHERCCGITSRKNNPNPTTQGSSVARPILVAPIPI
jgi:hypothetical protein